jgi:hypothetical protein
VVTLLGYLLQQEGTERFAGASGHTTALSVVTLLFRTMAQGHPQAQEAPLQSQSWTSEQPHATQQQTPSHPRPPWEEV